MHNLLTDKAKKDFIKFVVKNKNISTLVYLLIKFNILPFSILYGLITDFFDENKIHVFSQPGIFQETGWRCYYNSITGEKLNMQAWDSRKDARISGITKANKLYNDR